MALNRDSACGIRFPGIATRSCGASNSGKVFFSRISVSVTETWLCGTFACASAGKDDSAYSRSRFPLRPALSLTLCAQSCFSAARWTCRAVQPVADETCSIVSQVSATDPPRRPELLAAPRARHRIARIAPARAALQRKWFAATAAGEDRPKVPEEFSRLDVECFNRQR